MKLKSKILILILGFFLLAFGIYQYHLSQDRNHVFNYTTELHLYPKRSFTDEDKFEAIPTGEKVQILRIRESQDSLDVYIEVAGKKGWVSNKRSPFEIHQRQ